MPIAIRSTCSPERSPPCCSSAALGYGFWHGYHALANTTVSFGLREFSIAFLNEYWLQFELTSVLLVAAVVAALAVIRISRRSHG